MGNPGQSRLSPSALRWTCDPGVFSFRCTGDIPPLQEFIGQDRAIQAIEFGLEVRQPGYNIFVTGMAGTGKSSVLKAHLDQIVGRRRANGEGPWDWCYVHNFDNPDHARVLKLPPGKGRKLKSDIERLETRLRAGLAAAFSSKEYQAGRRRVLDEGQRARRGIMQALEDAAQRESFAVEFSPAGIGLIPVSGGHPMSDEEIMALSPESRKEIGAVRDRLVVHVEEALALIHDLEHQVRDRLEDLDGRVAEATVAGPFEWLAKEYVDMPGVLQLLEQLRVFARMHAELLRNGAQAPDDGEGPPAPAQGHLLPFNVNVFVDNASAKGPPIIVENNPTFSNLFGRIDRRFLMGGYVTDHTLLKPGALQSANGGYLVIDMAALVTNPLSWQALKRVIKAKEVRPEEASEALGIVVPQSIRPEAIPLDLKVIATGEPLLYQMLASYDEEFWETFKVRADFESRIERTPEHLQAYAAFICGACMRQGLRQFSPSGAAKVAEYGARIVADQTKLSTRFGMVNDLLVEADYWARAAGSEFVEALHVRKALEQKVYRSDALARRIEALVREGVVKVELTGEVIGQVNGLAVYSGGDITFGRPSRITARTFIGRGGVVNIEREAALSGRTHDKGVMIIGGYLGWKYAQSRPLPISATIAFEQSYEDIDGDSASSTEVYAVISSLAGLPLRQDVAVTGSVDQRGQVQAIGGVNQKIEGFYDLCRVTGLTGQQGVLIPAANTRDLMLREDVVEAVEQGKFHVYAAETIDEGLALLTGLPAGEPGPDGRYPEGTVHALVEQRLKGFLDALRAAGPVEAGQNGRGHGAAVPLTAVQAAFEE